MERGEIEPKIKDYFKIAINKKKKTFRNNRDNYLNKTLESSANISTIASHAGREQPVRPLAYEIWTNRKLSLKNHDRKYEGWKYLQNKVLDLHKDESYKILGARAKQPNILNYVNLHDELPEGIIEKRVSNIVEVAGEFDIREIWKRMCDEDPQIVASAQIFSYEEFKNQAPVKRT